MNINLFKLMVRINEKGHVTWHETCTCTGRLNANAF